MPIDNSVGFEFLGTKSSISAHGAVGAVNQVLRIGHQKAQSFPFRYSTVIFKFFKPETVCDCKISDILNTVGKRQLFQKAALSERLGTDIFNAFGERYRLKLLAVKERPVSDLFNT